MKRNPVIKISLRNFIRVLSRQFDTSKKESVSLFVELGKSQTYLPVRIPLKGSGRRKKAMDYNPNLTKYFCDTLYRYQKLSGAFVSKPITPEDARNWRRALHIKNFIFGQIPVNDEKILRKFILEAYKFCNSRGYKRMPIAFIGKYQNEILGRVIEKERGGVLPEEQEYYQYYWQKRVELSHEHYGKRNLVGGTREHTLVKDGIAIIEEYNVSIISFIDTQFAAFAVFDTFPSLLNMVNDKSRDRIAQAIAKGTILRRTKNSKKEDKYWDEVRRNAKHKLKS